MCIPLCKGKSRVGCSYCALYASTGENEGTVSMCMYGERYSCLCMFVFVHINVCVWCLCVLAFIHVFVYVTVCVRDSVHVFVYLGWFANMCVRIRVSMCSWVFFSFFFKIIVYIFLKSMEQDIIIVHDILT